MSEPIDLLTRPVGLLMVLILAFNLALIVMFWRDGKFNWIFEARGAKVDTSSKSWMGAASRAPRPLEYRRSSESGGKRSAPQAASASEAEASSTQDEATE